MLVNDPMYIMMIGMPGSGKSHLRQQLVDLAFQANQPLSELSTDDWIESLCRINGRTYSDNFQYMPEAEERLREKRKFAFDHNWSIIHDQTNLTVKSRHGKLAVIPKTYKKIAIYMTTSDAQMTEWLAQRLGKPIPQHVLDNMRKTAVVPSIDEGFDFVMPDYLALNIFK
jgi:tRNA uridine 5-carbamoylmethylation protein Kti12